MRLTPDLPFRDDQRTLLRALSGYSLAIMSDPLLVYWANAIFSDADRDYNARCGAHLRKNGYNVHLPQEAGVNAAVAARGPSAGDVFLTDTSRILASHVLVACLDQESIDAGVAAELGIAYTVGLPVIGLYTDFRQLRTGAGRMYKNLFVLGCLEASLGVVTTLDALVKALAPLRSGSGRQRGGWALSNGFRPQPLKARTYTKHVDRLERWYEPQWSLGDALRPYLTSLRPNRVLDFGCGTGRLAAALQRTGDEVEYIGYDASAEMIAAASGIEAPPRFHFTTEWASVRAAAAKRPFDLAVIAFVLHDQEDPAGVLSTVARCVRKGGHVIVIDLSSWDLPRMTRLLRRGLASPLGVPDRRLSAEGLIRLLPGSRLAPPVVSIATPVLRFPTRGDFVQHIMLFDILAGSDLPVLGLPRTMPARSKRLLSLVAAEPFPFQDQRAFLVASMKVLE